MNEDLESDARLLGALGAAFESVPPIPPHLTEFARSVVDWALIDAQVAHLTFDSGVERSAGLRSDEANERALSYAGDELEIELTMMVDTAVGQITPAAGYVVRLQTPTGELETATDERGRFRFPPIRLPARLAVSGQAVRLVTPWLTA
jgi:hypothetical protein